eukprot:TRINITY_DN6587_c0_g1_i1.p1 TRINITY_DN6587_c0_g1~~TRINITY_DN6587_c0_g1_i1.p1  ORF type:complete len:282 (-),score=-21.08 TRINITY_DN6587_c0_g1_i1:1-846(-)
MCIRDRYQRRVHGHWRYRSNYARGSRQWMRLTGQATTAIGNAIVNMLIHSELILKNFKQVELALFLGDDSLILLNSNVDCKKLRSTIAAKYNMQSKNTIHAEYGVFCQLVAYKTNDGVDLGPDYVRLKNRYEVTNGVSESTPENIAARTMSYCAMIGDTPEVRKLCQIKKYDLILSAWYDQPNLIRALSIKYDISTMEVINNYKQLISMMTSQHVTTHKFLHWVSKQLQLKPNFLQFQGRVDNHPPPHVPVSYTHLRAHETDSYLVCRLLLEKKKNTYIHL